MIDLTPIFQAVIALLAALITYKLIPWIRSKTDAQTQRNLETAARVAVYAAEQIFGAGHGADKMDYAIGVLENSGFTLDADVIRATLESAVREMNADDWYPTEPEKEPEEEPTEEPAENPVE